jgi:hypothetical protein
VGYFFDNSGKHFEFFRWGKGGTRRRRRRRRRRGIKLSCEMRK